MTTWRTNDVATLRARFISLAGNLTDPTTVTVKLRSPSGVITTYTYASASVTKDSTGVYSRVLTFSEAGVWAYSVVATGTITKTEEGSVRVLGSDYGL